MFIWMFLECIEFILWTWEWCNVILHRTLPTGAQFWWVTYVTSAIPDAHWWDERAMRGISGVILSRQLQKHVPALLRWILVIESLEWKIIKGSQKHYFLNMTKNIVPIYALMQILNFNLALLISYLFFLVTALHPYAFWMLILFLLLLYGHMHLMLFLWWCKCMGTKTI